MPTCSDAPSLEGRLSEGAAKELSDHVEGRARGQWPAAPACCRPRPPRRTARPLNNLGLLLANAGRGEETYRLAGAYHFRGRLRADAGFAPLRPRPEFGRLLRGDGGRKE